MSGYDGYSKSNNAVAAFAATEAHNGDYRTAEQLAFSVAHAFRHPAWLDLEWLQAQCVGIMQQGER